MIPKKIPPPGRILQIMPAPGWRAFDVCEVMGLDGRLEPDPDITEVPVVGWALIEDPEPRSYDPPVEVVLIIEDREYGVIPSNDDLLDGSIHRVSPIDDIAAKKKEWIEEGREKIKRNQEKRDKAAAQKQQAGTHGS
jgi:hypothetical protein